MGATRRDFENIAYQVRTSPLFDNAQRRAIAETLIPALQMSNPNFDRARFLYACIDHTEED